MIGRPLSELDFQLAAVQYQKQKVPLKLKTIEYKCQIINNLLKTTLVQTFRESYNLLNSEIIYFFPFDENICLESFEAIYDNKIQRGVIKPKEEALLEYNKNKSYGNVVSYASVQNIRGQEYFEIQLANIPPDQEVEIVLSYSQNLTCVFNKFYLAQIPLLHVDDSSLVKLGKGLLKLDLFCTGKITYASAKGCYTQKSEVDDNHTIFIVNQNQIYQSTTFQVIFSFEGMFEPQVIYGSSKIYHEDTVKRAILPTSHSVMVTLMPNFNEENTSDINDTVRAAIRNGEDILGKSFEKKINDQYVDFLNSSKSEFIFLLDRSGSMYGPLEKACKALILFLKSLPNDSFFNVISFGTTTQKLFKRSQYYETGTLNQAVRIISKYRADLGGTNIFEPLSEIFTEKRICGYNRQIFLFTDGGVSNPQSVINLIKKNNKLNRVHAIGFGQQADQQLIKNCAIAGKGVSRYCDLYSSLEEIIIEMLTNSISPSLDQFYIEYDTEVFQSTFPSNPHFPCVFKDQIFTIHLFFNPQVDVSSLTDEQKEIQIVYFDSHKNQKVKKVLKLEMTDSFACNVELQETVFRLGKLQQLNLQENQVIKYEDRVQQAIDFQLLTQDTSIICVIHTLDDQQKAKFIDQTVPPPEVSHLPLPQVPEVCESTSNFALNIPEPPPIQILNSLASNIDSCQQQQQQQPKQKTKQQTKLGLIIVAPPLAPQNMITSDITPSQNNIPKPPPISNLLDLGRPPTSIPIYHLIPFGPSPVSQPPNPPPCLSFWKETQNSQIPPQLPIFQQGANNQQILPPPPPPPFLSSQLLPNQIIPQAPSQPFTGSSQMSVPPPPPLLLSSLPPNQITLPPNQQPPPPPAPFLIGLNQIQLQTTAQVNPQNNLIANPPPQDRSSLLEQIRNPKINLRKQTNTSQLLNSHNNIQDRTQFNISDFIGHTQPQINCKNNIFEETNSDRTLIDQLKQNIQHRFRSLGPNKLFDASDDSDDSDEEGDKKRQPTTTLSQIKQQYSIAKSSDSNLVDKTQPADSEILKYPLTFEEIVEQVNTNGSWKYDVQILRKCITNFEEDAIKALFSNFTEIDGLMTLFILIILEQFFISEKPKWILISKKSIHFIKSSLAEGVEMQTVKQLITQFVQKQ